MSETLGNWKERKKAQAMRLIDRYPGWCVDAGGDYETKFVLVNQVNPQAIIFGQLPWNDRMQPSIDLSDDEVGSLILADDGRS